MTNVQTDDQALTGVAGAGSPQRDFAAEQATAAELGVDVGNLSPLDELDLAIATYGENLPLEYQALEERLGSLSGGGIENQGALGELGADISSFGQSALGFSSAAVQQGQQIEPQLNVLQEALRRASGVGNQKLGTSETFAKAGVSGFGALAASLNARRDEMDFKYESFANVVNRIADAQYSANAQLQTQAQTTLAQYETLRDEYRFEQQRLDNVIQQAQAFEKEVDLINLQYQNELNLLNYKAQLEAANSYTWRDLTGGSGYVGSDGTTYYPSGTSSSSGSVQILGDASSTDVAFSEFAANCVKYARNFAPNLKFGLWSISDKAAAVEFTDPSQVSVGDVVLTKEGSYGHAAIITGLTESGEWILQEANYKAGQITAGRTLSAGSGLILGYVKGGGGAALTEEEHIQQIISSAQATTTGLPGGFDRLNEQIIAASYEGANPSGAEQFYPSQRYGAEDLGKAFETVMNFDFSFDTEKVQQATLNYYSSYVMDGDFSDAKQVLLEAAISSFDVETAKQIRGRQSTLANLIAIQDLVHEYVDNGGRIGLFTGSAEKVANKLGQTTDPKLQSISVQLQSLLFQYVKSVSGSQFTVEEMKKYENIFPTISTSLNVFDSRVNGATEFAETTNRSQLGGRLGGSEVYDKIFGRDTLLEERGYSNEAASAVQNAMKNLFNTSL